MTGTRTRRSDGRARPGARTHTRTISTFGDGGGTKAEIDVYEVKEQYGSRTVRAFVQLPVEDADDIGARIGEDVHFEGRLVSCDGSARRLYVADARMVD